MCRGLAPSEAFVFLLGVSAVDDLGYCTGVAVFLRHARVLCGHPAALRRHSFTLNCHRISQSWTQAADGYK